MDKNNIINIGIKIIKTIEHIRASRQTDGIDGFTLMHRHCKELLDDSPDWESYCKLVSECSKILYANN